MAMVHRFMGQPMNFKIASLRLGSLCLAVAMTAGGCSSVQNPPAQAQQVPGKTLGGTDEQIFIGDSIEKNYGFRSLIHAIVADALFLRK